MASRNEHGWQGKAHAAGPMHARLSEARGPVPGGYVVLMTVRNPYDRAVSLANAYCGGDLWALARGEIAKRPRFCKPQSVWLDAESAGEVRLIRFERLAEDFFMVCKELDIPFGGEFPHLNPSGPRKPWWAFYDGQKDLADAICRVYGKDFERFGYQRALSVAGFESGQR